MKKIFSSLVLIAIFFGCLPKNIFASDTGYFIVTAYYSPLPGQNYYITGNYESEKRLNGNGIAGASGKKVFSGMLAAPGKYAFGTKIQLEGLGVGSVDDRGGAIVPAGERGYGHDRIDIWVGSGDEGLRRAMYWGKRKIAGKVISKSSSITLDYMSIPAPSWAVPKSTTLYGNTVQVAQNVEQTIEKKQDIFSVSLGKGSDEAYITELQDILQEIGYYTHETSNGLYDSATINAVYNFQVNNDIIVDETSKGAGSYGPQTRKKLQEVYNLYLDEKRILEENIQAIKIFEQESITIAQDKVEKLGNISYGDISSQVREFQKILAEIGYFDYKDTAIFGIKTRNSLIEFQLENKIIENTDDTGTGIFGPKTKQVITEKLSKSYLLQVLELEGLTEIYNDEILVDGTNVKIDEVQISIENKILTI